MDGRLKVICPVCKSEHVSIEKAFDMPSFDWLYSCQCLDCGHEGYYTQKQMRFKRA